MVPVLDGRCWVAEGDAYGTAFRVELFASRRHAGYYYYAAACLADPAYDATQRPLKADALQASLDGLLKDHGLVVADLEWRAVPATELVLLCDRVHAGD
jgi:hypothetical protein